MINLLGFILVVNEENIYRYMELKRDYVLILWVLYNLWWEKKLKMLIYVMCMIVVGNFLGN